MPALPSISPNRGLCLIAQRLGAFRGRALDAAPRGTASALLGLAAQFLRALRAAGSSRAARWSFFDFAQRAGLESLRRLSASFWRRFAVALARCRARPRIERARPGSHSPWPGLAPSRSPLGFAAGDSSPAHAGRWITRCVNASRRTVIPLLNPGICGLRTAAWAREFDALRQSGRGSPAHDRAAPSVKPEPKAVIATSRAAAAARRPAAASVEQHRDRGRRAVAVALDVVAALLGRDARALARRTR